MIGKKLSLELLLKKIIIGTYENYKSKWENVENK